MFELIVVVLAVIVFLRLGTLSGRIRALENYNVELRRWLDKTLAAQAGTPESGRQPDSAEPQVAEDPFLRPSEKDTETKG